MGTWFLQTWLAGAVLVPVTAVLRFSMGGPYDGFITLIGLILVPAVFCVLLISLVTLLGLPLRIVRRWEIAWRARRWLSLAVAGFGLLLVVVARALATTEVWSDEFGSYETYWPQPVLVIAGLLLLAFGLVHTWFTRYPAASPIEAPGLDSGPRNG